MSESAVPGDQQAAPLVPQSFTSNGGANGLDQDSSPGILATSARACLQLNNGASTFFINATLNVNAYPYTILGGGSISGSICGSPSWVLTGGTVGGSITINGRYVGAGACASTITVVGPFGPPAGYAGTYGFNGASNSFPHRTLFLGFNRPTCP